MAQQYPLNKLKQFAMKFITHKGVGRKRRRRARKELPN
jgi:hypothetical protein